MLKGAYEHPSGAFTSLQAVPPFLYAAMGTSDYGFIRIDVADAADPRAMKEKGAWAVPDGEQPRGIMVSGPQACLLAVNLTTHESRLYILDVSDPANILLNGSCTFSGEGTDLVLSADGALASTAYYKDGTDQGIRLVSLADPSAPCVLGSGKCRAQPLCQWLSDSLAFVGSNTAGQGQGSWYIEAFNIADPSSPVQIGETTGSGMIVDMEVMDGRLYASVRGGSVYEFEYIIKNRLMILGLIAKCPSPSSVFLVLFHLTKLFYACTCDGAISGDGVMVSASLGIFAQYKDVKSLVDSVYEVLISPATHTMAVGQTQTFKAEGKDQQGNPVALKNPAWSSTAGKGTLQPSPDGSSCDYSAKSVGNDSVLCTVQGTTVKGVSTIQINATAVDMHPNAQLQFSLAQNHPNPFNPVTTIGYTVKERCRVNLQVYDLLGRRVAILVDEEQAAGEYRIRFDARGYPTGILLYRIQMDDFSAVRKMVLLE